MSNEEVVEDDLGAKLLSMVEGSDFDKKMDLMFNAMLEKGMTEDQIIKQMMGTMKVEQGENEEVNFDPEGMVMDPEMMKEFEALMNA